MGNIKIIYLGNDKGVASRLEESVARGSGDRFAAYPDDDGFSIRAGESAPDVVIVDRGEVQAGSLPSLQRIRGMFPGVDFVVVFIFREGNLDAALDALSGGYDLCWDAGGVGSDLFRAALEREVVKKRDASDRHKELLISPAGGGILLNETVASLVEGTVELLALKEDLEKRNRELELVRKELEQFVHAVSHDLKEPLMALRTFTKMLSEDIGNTQGDAAEHLRMVRQSVERMSRQIDGLLAFSRAGRVKHESTVDDPATIIADIERDRGFDCRDDVEIRIQSALPPLKAHPEQLRQIFGNLISNGIKYNRNTNKVIEIGVAAAPPREIEGSFPDNEDAGEFALIYISDNGIGIQAVDKNAPFELFRRLNESPEFEGDGAGLAIVKRAVNSLGGVIDYISELDKGTVMYFTLPRAAKSVAAQTHKQKEQKRSAVQLRNALFGKS